MAPVRTHSSEDLSPSARHDVATLFGRPGVSTRESVEGSALAGVGALAVTVAALVAVAWLRRRR